MLLRQRCTVPLAAPVIVAEIRFTHTAPQKNNKRMSYRLELDERPGAAIRRIAAEQTELALAEIVDPDNPVASRVHELRKCCKRVRAVVRLARPALPEFRSINTAYRDIARQVSSHRDARVMADLVSGIAASARFATTIGDDAVVRWFEFRAEIAEQSAAPALFDVQKRLADAAAQIEDWPLNDLRPETVIDSFVSTVSKFHAGKDAVRRERSVAALHEWRKRSKDYWYQLQVLSELLPVKARKSIDDFDTLCELIGTAHDRSILIDHLDGLPDFLRNTNGTERVSAIAMRAHRRMRTQALALADAALDSSPEAMAAKLRRRWLGQGGAAKRQ